MTASIPESLRFEVTAPAEVRRGQAVPITLRLTNASDRVVEAHFLGREIAFDIVVTAEDGTVVWRRLGDAAVPSILQVRLLQPGQMLEWSDVWRPGAPGRYGLQGVMPSDAPAPLRTPVRALLVR